MTICTYAVDVTGIVDLRTDAGRLSAGVSLSDLSCAWAYERALGEIPASWLLAQRLIGAGVPGILVPSFARGARPEAANLVLWRWGSNLPCQVLVHDPDSRLPRNQASWDD